jgi:putative hydrolase of the HAD superfamily
VKPLGVLFDLDGTLVDHESAAVAGLRAWLPAIGVAPTAAAVAGWLALQEPHLAAWRAGEISFPEQRRRRLRAFLGLHGQGTDGTDAELDELFAGYLVHYERAWRAYDDVAEALALVERAGLRTAVLTNGTREQQLRKLDRTGLAGRVGPVFTVDDLGVAKPHPDAFRTACARWGLTPGEVLSVGDNYDLDVVAARAAGLQAVHLDRLGRGPGTEPPSLTSLRDLARFLVSGGARPGVAPAG